MTTHWDIKLQEFYMSVEKTSEIAFLFGQDPTKVKCYQIYHTDT